MGIPISLLLIAVGAILTWAVTAQPSGIDLDVVGIILMAVGLAGLLLTLLFWQSWWGPRYFHRTAHVPADSYGSRRAYYRGRRRTVVEEDELPPDAPY